MFKKRWLGLGMLWLLGMSACALDSGLNVEIIDSDPLATEEIRENFQYTLRIKETGGQCGARDIHVTVKLEVCTYEYAPVTLIRIKNCDKIAKNKHEIGHLSAGGKTEKTFIVNLNQQNINSIKIEDQDWKSECAGELGKLVNNL